MRAFGICVRECVYARVRERARKRVCVCVRLGCSPIEYVPL